MSINLKGLLKNLFKIVTGFMVAFVFGMIVYTLADFVLATLRINSQENWGYLGKMIVSFLLFCGLWFFWIKAKTVKMGLIIISVVIVSYFAGKVYATKATEQYRKAEQLISEARNDRLWAGSKDTQLYMEGARKNVSRYKEATSLNLDYFPEYKKYVNDLYGLRNELLTLDEKLKSGELVYTQEEWDIKAVDYEARQKAIDDKNFLMPFWMAFYQTL